MKSVRMLAAVVIAWGAAVFPARAVDVWLEIKQAGSVVPTDAVYSWVKVTGFDKGLDTPMPAGTVGAGTGVPAARTAVITMAGDRAIANLMDASARGESRDLTLHVTSDRSGTTRVLLAINFNGVFFTKIATHAATGDDDVMFDVSFVYQQETWTSTYQGSAGIVATAAGFDFTHRTKIDIPPLVPQAGGYPVVTDDADHDGIPDAWETAHGLNPADPNDANEDADHDGWTNRDEYFAGTDPRSGNSFLRLTLLGPGSPQEGQITLTWNSLAGRKYTVQAAADPGTGFTTIATVPAANGSQTSYITTAATGRFFRVHTELDEN